MFHLIKLEIVHTRQDTVDNSFFSKAQQNLGLVSDLMAKKRERMSRCGQSVECSICSIEKLYLLKLWKCICRGPVAVRSSQWTAAVQIFQLSWWWQFPTGGSSSKAQLLPQCRLQSPILLLSLCLASVLAAVAIALLCCLAASGVTSVDSDFSLDAVQ